MASGKPLELRERRAILVLGPHRAGTSATTRLLNLLGVDLGAEDQLIGSGNEQNLKGFFENRFIMRINDAVLAQQGGTWAYPPPLEPGWERDPGLNQLRAEARDLLQQNFGQAALWGFKDPRVCLTLPFWKELIGPASYVICVRNALEVVGSLVRRDNLPRRDAIETWTRHLAGAIVHSHGSPRMFVSFDELFTDRARAVADLAGFVGLPELGRDGEFLALVDEFLEGGLKHHEQRLSDVVADQELPADTRVLQALLELAVRSRLREPALRGGNSGGTVDDAIQRLAATFENARLDRVRRLSRTGARTQAEVHAPMSAPAGELPDTAALADFVVLGAPHSGAAAFWDLLHDHPQLSLVVEGRETKLLADSAEFAEAPAWDRESHDGRVRGLICEGCIGGSGTASVDTVARRLGSLAPQAKLVALVRNPIDRAIDDYRDAVRRGLERRGLVQALRQQLTAEALRAAREWPTNTNGYLILGEYGRILETFRRNLPNTEMLVLAAEELERDPAPLVGRILRFLGVDPLWRPPDLKRRARISDEEPLVDLESAKRLASQLARTVFPLAGTRKDEASRAFSSAFDDWNRGEAPSPADLPDDLLRSLRIHYAGDARRLADVYLPWRDVEPESLKVLAVGKPEVSIVIPILADVAEAKQVVESVIKATDGDYELVLVGDSASDELSTLSSSVGARLVELNDATDFATAANSGLEVASGSEIVILSEDCRLTRGWLTNMRQALRSGDDVAAVGPRSNFAAGPQGGVWVDDTSAEGIARFARMFNHPDSHRWFDVDALGAFALLARLACLKQVGGLHESENPERFMPGETSARLKRAGYRLICAGDAFVYRVGGGFSDALLTPLRSAPTEVEPARLVEDRRGQVFEVHEAYVSPVESDAALKLIREGRSIEKTGRAVLRALPPGPPVCFRRVTGSETVWLLRADSRRRVTGDQHRIRRLPGVGTINAAQLAWFMRGPDVDVAAAIDPVSTLRPLLPNNPAEIQPGRLAALADLTAEIATALEHGRGYALIRLGRREALLLADGGWPLQSRVPASARESVRELRAALIDADAVGVPTGRESFTLAPLIEQALFHLDLYPRRLLDSELGYELLGFDPTNGRELGSAPLRGLLGDRPIAVVGGSARTAQRYADLIDFKVALAVNLQGSHTIEDAFTTLAASRDAYEAVLVSADPVARLLCPRLARELDVVALDLGHAVERLLYRRYGELTPGEVLSRFSIERYVEEVSEPPPEPEHPLEGRLVRRKGRASVFYVERGKARSVSHRALVPHLGSEVEVVDDDALEAIPRGLPLYPVRPRASRRLHLLLDGGLIPLELSLPIPEAEQLPLDGLLHRPPIVDWFPGAALRESPAVRSPAPEVVLASPSPGDEPAPDLAFLMCVEEGPLEQQAVLLCESIREHGGRFANSAIYAVSPRPGLRITAHGRSRLADLDVQYVEEDLNTSGELAEMPVQGNKPLSAAYIEGATDHQFVVVLDTDTVMLNEPVELQLDDDEDVAIRPADMRGIATTGRPGDPRDDYWHRLCAALGVPYESIPRTQTFVDKSDVKAYYQTGCVCVRRDRGVLRTWGRFLKSSVGFGIGPNLDDRPKATSIGLSSGLGSTWWGIDIPTLSLAVWSTTNRVRLLSARYNYPLHLHDRISPDARPARAADMAIVHYHWLFNADRIEENPMLKDPDFRLSGELADWVINRIPIDTATVAVR